jgi:glutamate dehydrogenase
MNSSEEKKKSDHLQAIGNLLREGERGEQVAEFAHQLLQRVPAAELAGVDSHDHAVLARNLFEFAQRRLAGEIKVRIFNPEPDREGWDCSHTVIEIINDDMPFLVDSVVLALSELSPFGSSDRPSRNAGSP